MWRFKIIYYYIKWRYRGYAHDNAHVLALSDTFGTDMEF